MKTLNILSAIGVAVLLMASTVTASARGNAPAPRQPRIEAAPAPAHNMAPERMAPRHDVAPAPDYRHHEPAPRPDDRIAPAPRRSHLDPVRLQEAPRPMAFSRPAPAHR